MKNILGSILLAFVITFNLHAENFDFSGIWTEVNNYMVSPNTEYVNIDFAFFEIS